MAVFLALASIEDITQNALSGGTGPDSPGGPGVAALAWQAYTVLRIPLQRGRPLRHRRPGPAAVTAIGEYWRRRQGLSWALGGREPAAGSERLAGLPAGWVGFLVVGRWGRPAVRHRPRPPTTMAAMSSPRSMPDTNDRRAASASAVPVGPGMRAATWSAPPSDGSPIVDCLPLSSSARTSGTELRVLGAGKVLARIEPLASAAQ